MWFIKQKKMFCQHHKKNGSQIVLANFKKQSIAHSILSRFKIQISRICVSNCKAVTVEEGIKHMHTSKDHSLCESKIDFVSIYG